MLSMDAGLGMPSVGGIGCLLRFSQPVDVTIFITKRQKNTLRCFGVALTRCVPSAVMVFQRLQMYRQLRFNVVG